MATETTILTLNAGSSSLKLGLFTARDEQVHRSAGARVDTDDQPPESALTDFLSEHGISNPDKTIHRVVHGGPDMRQAVEVDDDVLGELEGVSELAPLHNPPALDLLRRTLRLFGDESRQFAAFDTTFFADLPKAAITYALPRELNERYGLRRYGFHGLAYQYMWQRWCDLAPRLPAGGRLIAFQLGSGCSAAAIRNGHPQETSMGFTPLEGLVMTSRAGDTDPGLLAYLARQEHLEWDDLDDLLNHRSGLKGLSGISGDMGDLLASSDPAAADAVDVFVHRARKYLGAYLTILGGVDGIVFGGGIGERSHEIRGRILDGMEWAGLHVDRQANRDADGVEARISTSVSPVEAWVVPVDEEQLLAETALSL